MTEVKETVNIPSLTVSRLSELLTVLYVAAFRSDQPLNRLFTPFLWGPAGVGKSESVFQLAERLSAEMSKQVKVTDVRLLLFSPVDLRGIPAADEKRQFTNWLKPRLFDMNPGEDVINILFLDELSAAPPALQAAAYQICLDRKIGEHSLPENCIVIAAGNRTSDQGVAYKMPKPLCNRLMHFNIETNYDAWRKWAVRNGISDKVISYLGFDNSRLCVEPQSRDLAYPTPRSWVAVSRLLTTTGMSPSELHPLIAACIGIDAAVEFEGYCNGILQMPSVDEILAGRCKDFPKTHDVLYALVSALTAKVQGLGEELTADQLENLCRYAFRFPKDFAVSLMGDLREIPGMNRRLMKCPSFQSWLNKNKNVL